MDAPSQNAALSGQLVRQLARHVHLIWRLKAATGAETQRMIDRLARIDIARSNLARGAANHFDVAILALGVNDVTHGTTRRGWIARQPALHDLLRNRFGVRRIIASGLPPMGRFPLLPQPLRWVVGQQARRFDAALARLAGPNLIHVPMRMKPDPRFVAEDSDHPSPAAHTEWAGILAAHVLDPQTHRPHP